VAVYTASQTSVEELVGAMTGALELSAKKDADSATPGGAGQPPGAEGDSHSGNQNPSAADGSTS
jgi:hypothetical protein